MSACHWGNKQSTVLHFKYISCLCWQLSMSVANSMDCSHRLLIAGLCGTWDGDNTNELTKKSGEVDTDSTRRPNIFIETWRWVSIYNCCNFVLNMYNHFHKTVIQLHIWTIIQYQDIPKPCFFIHSANSVIVGVLLESAFNMWRHYGGLLYKLLFQIVIPELELVQCQVIKWTSLYLQKQCPKES